MNWFDWATDIGQAWLKARSDRASGGKMAMTAGEAAEARGQLPFATWAYHAAIRISAPRRAAGRLKKVASRCDGPLPAAMGEHVTALVDNDVEGLVRASETFEKLGMSLLAAEAAATGARLTVRRGKRAGALRDRARRLANATEGAWSPALEDLPSSPVVLSPREMTVARLARDGKSSPEIAAMLDISVRTVDSHLARVYLKLGVAGRLDLAGALTRQSHETTDPSSSLD
jgi:DNA-binding CsgD family transcriptional regulator